jgi:tRNA threonylcarbamoyl adenosine modification protein YeaZ
MFSLFIDTTQSVCYLAVLQNTKLIGKFQTPTHNNLTDIVIEHIDTLLKDNDIDKEDITKVYIVNGPGSFTGVRVNALIAKAFAIANKASIYYLDALSFQLPSTSGISILDARGDNQFVMIKNKGKMLLKPQMLKASEVKKLINKYSLPAYAEYKDIDVFSNFIFHFKSFKLAKNIDNFSPLYIKKALN